MGIFSIRSSSLGYSKGKVHEQPTYIGTIEIMFRMYRYKDHFEYRKENPLIKVAEGIERNEAVPVTGTWDDSKMYAPYPYEDAILNPNLK